MVTLQDNISSLCSLVLLLNLSMGPVIRHTILSCTIDIHPYSTFIRRFRSFVHSVESDENIEINLNQCSSQDHVGRRRKAGNECRSMAQKMTVYEFGVV